MSIKSQYASRMNGYVRNLMDEGRWSEIFSYDGATGNLIWKSRPDNVQWNAKWAGSVAGCRTKKDGDKPYSVYVTVAYKQCKASRIIWEMHYGSIPPQIQIDHKDLNPFNNRLSNLRLATSAQNMYNVPKTIKNTSGLKGVVWDVAHAKAASRYHGKFARGA